MSIESLSSWVQLLVVITAIAHIPLGAVAYWLNQRFASRAKVKELASRIDALEVETKAIQDAAPTQQHVHALAMGIANVEGELKGMSKEISGLRELVKRVEKPIEILIESQMKPGSKQ